VALGPDGTLYVTDHFNDRVQRFSSEGRFQAQLGTGQMTAASAATATAVKAAAALTAADAPQSVIASPTAQPTSTPLSNATPQSTPSPTPATAAATLPDAQLRRPEGIAVDHDGNLWVADYGRDRVVKLAPDGRLLLSWGGRGSGPGEFVGPKGVAIDPTSGRLYVADTGNARVQRLAPDGTAEASWPLPPLPLP
jgi:DNA-binding beta-propeller fold protein YncE